jgi:hypothetical protein
MRRHVMAVLLMVSGAALAQGTDVGLVNLVSGEVGFAPTTGSPGKVSAFMRVRDGDRFEVPAGAQLRVVYLEGGRQERWQGPASFRAGKSAGEPISGAAAEITNLPAGVPQKIARVPELVQNAKLGGIQLRGGSVQAQKGADFQEPVREARAIYERISKELPADDITPELFLYAAYSEFHLYDDMKSVVAAMRRKQPSSEDIIALEGWLQRRTGN